MSIRISDKDIAVVIPVYKENPGDKELKYFQHNCKVLENYSIYLVAPEGMATGNYQKETDLQIEYFEATYFQNIAGYNRLMLSKEFYKRFERYRYVLICQTDAFVFRDELLSWCRRGYDYIGAPWINRPFFLFQYVVAKMGLVVALQMALKNNLKKAVGNGGLSLRRIDSFITALKQEKDISRWKINEDFYWSFFARVNGESLRKPGTEEASLFGIELSPRKTMNKQNNQLPMGIHAWEKYDPLFWRQYIKEALNTKKVTQE